MRLGGLFILLMIPVLAMAQKSFSLELLSQSKHEFRTNDVWGFVDSDGVEHAVVGTEFDCRIYNLSNPSSPEIVKIVPGAQSTWRDFKSYRSYVYQITQRGQDGLTIIDMTSSMDSIPVKLFRPTIQVAGNQVTLNTCHNIWIDENVGRAFLAGCNPGVGGVLIFDIASDPWNPRHIGTLNERYSHDVITNGDIVFSSEINEGNLGIYDISQPSRPILISRTATSSNFTHNAWYSDDGNYLFTTDERRNGYLDAYDISDLSSPKLIDQYRPKNSGGIIPHNAHYHKGFLFISWYSEGLIILDAHRPDNLVKVGQYDTFTSNGSGFQGAWGAYPFFPSQNILVSDISSGLFVLKPTFARAAYLEGEVFDISSGLAINGVSITLSGENEIISDVSNALGIYKTGSAFSGNYQVIIEHPDYITDTTSVQMVEGEVIQLDFGLQSKASVITIAGSITNEDGAPIDNAVINFYGQEREFQDRTDENGNYQLRIPMNEYEIHVGSWGFRGKNITRTIEEPLQEPIRLEKGYEDDFFADLGWVTGGTASHGRWTRVVPLPTLFEGKLSNPNADVDNDIGEFCFVTGNNDATVGADDVDNGVSILTSPIIDVSLFKNAIIEVTPWYYNDGGNSPPNDSMNFYLLSDKGKTLAASILNGTGQSGQWREPVKIYVDSIDKRDKTVQLQIEVTDHPTTGHLSEGAVDRFRVYEGPLPQYPTDQKEIIVDISPNPTDNVLYVEPRTNQKMRLLRLYDTLGRVVVSVNDPSEEINIGYLADGTYLIEVIFDNDIKSGAKIIKVQ